MGLAIFKIKIMPKSPNSDLEKIEKKAKEITEKENCNSFRAEKEPIAFGLTALNILFTREETLDSDELLEKLRKIKEVNSAEIIDFRRAVG
ncbi:MAG: elongation factor 1-beta [Candidatus Pacearchaeota archaeon]